VSRKSAGQAMRLAADAARACQPLMRERLSLARQLIPGNSRGGKSPALAAVCADEDHCFLARSFRTP